MKMHVNVWTANLGDYFGLYKLSGILMEHPIRVQEMTVLPEGIHSRKKAKTARIDLDIFAEIEHVCF